MVLTPVSTAAAIIGSRSGQKQSKCGVILCVSRAGGFAGLGARRFGLSGDIVMAAGRRAVNLLLPSQEQRAGFRHRQQQTQRTAVPEQLSGSAAARPAPTGSDPHCKGNKHQLEVRRLFAAAVDRFRFLLDGTK